MGYYVAITNADFVIPAENVVKAYQAMCKLNERDDLKRGGSWERGKQVAKWFSWMSPDYPERCKNAEEIFKMLGFEVDNDPLNGLSIEGYDSKSGQEELFLEACAPFAKDGSFVEWCGEDREMWRDVVCDGKLQRRYATITFDRP